MPLGRGAFEVRKPFASTTVRVLKPRGFDGTGAVIVAGRFGIVLRMIAFTSLIDRLENFSHSLPALVANLADQDAKWKPADGNWSILEVVRHLLDEEVEDFRARLRCTIESPGQAWPGIDPEGWAVARNYNEASLAHTAARFVAERRISVDWLRELDASAWTIAYQHPQFGPIHAGDLLAAWAAHDALHLRQIAKRMYGLAQRDAGEFTTIYAGEWHA